jgi:hypothetical protein
MIYGLGMEADEALDHRIDVYTKNYTKYKELSNSCDVVE